MTRTLKVLALPDIGDASGVLDPPLCTCAASFNACRGAGSDVGGRLSRSRSWSAWNAPVAIVARRCGLE
jgi:hypothetical protein